MVCLLTSSFLLQCDPSGAYFAWKATAMGKNYVNGKTFLEKRYDDKIELEDAVHNAILTLKEGFEGEVNICDARRPGANPVIHLGVKYEIN